jgi:hypothetical protein
MNTSAAKKVTPLLVCRAAIVVFVTVNEISWNCGPADPCLQFAAAVHEIPKLKGPVPSPLNPPAVVAWFACSAGAVLPAKAMLAEMLVIWLKEVMSASLNLKYCMSPEPDRMK